MSFFIIPRISFIREKGKEDEGVDLTDSIFGKDFYDGAKTYCILGMVRCYRLMQGVWQNMVSTGPWTDTHVSTKIVMDIKKIA